jgi:toxin ParE1/3/4
VSVIIKLTDRAHYDFQKIEDYFLQKWRRETADRYLEDIQIALSLLQESPDLLRHKSDISTQFKFYRVREHFLVCTKLKDVLFILTIKHGKMDLPTRLGELEPTLVQEADLLHKRLVTAEKKRHKSHFKK